MCCTVAGVSEKIKGPRARVVSTVLPLSNGEHVAGKDRAGRSGKGVREGGMGTGVR